MLTFFFPAFPLPFQFVTLIFFNLFGLASPISNLAGFALPAYLSIQALESAGTNDDKQWLSESSTRSSSKASDSR